MPTKIYSAYSPPPQIGIDCGPQVDDQGDPCHTGRTQQHQKDECDINMLMERFQKSGVITHLAQGPPQYGDFSAVQDYETAKRRCAEAESDFAELPALIRRRFDDDPANLLEFLSNEENDAEAIAMGLLPPMPNPEAEVNLDPPTPETPAPPE